MCALSHKTGKINPSMKQVHVAGEKVFVDYSGLTIPIVNQTTGEITQSQIFVAVLGSSGYTFVHATYSQKQRDFILSHTLAYKFFEGVPKIVVPDNLKSAVIKNNKDGVICIKRSTWTPVSETLGQFNKNIFCKRIIA